MSPQPDHNPYVRQVVLPSGRTIDVVYFEDRQAAARSVRPERVSDTDLHICGSCGSDLVYPVEWEEAGATHWRVELRCPNCEWTGTGVHEQSVVERFDAELDRATESLVEDLQSLTRANMEEDVERFAIALRDGHILPSDF
jgi:hypothetical protein